MAMAVGMVITPSTAATGTQAPQRACGIRRSSTLPLVGVSQQRSGRSGKQWAPLRVRSVAAGPPKSAAEVDWKTKRETLMKNRIRSVNAKEALRLQQEQGYTILDVRPEAEFAEAHPKGAINAQVYRLIKEWTAWDIARRAAFAFFGIFSGTEENPDFLKEIEGMLDKESPIVVACNMGGTTRPSAAMSMGKESRSLIAAYILTLDGYKNLAHMDGGIRSWFKEGLPVDEPPENTN